MKNKTSALWRGRRVSAQAHRGGRRWGKPKANKGQLQPDVGSVRGHWASPGLGSTWPLAPAPGEKPQQPSLSRGNLWIPSAPRGFPSKPQVSPVSLAPVWGLFPSFSFCTHHHQWTHSPETPRCDFPREGDPRADLFQIPPALVDPLGRERFPPCPRQEILIICGMRQDFTSTLFGFVYLWWIFSRTPLAIRCWHQINLFMSLTWFLRPSLEQVLKSNQFIHDSHPVGFKWSPNPERFLKSHLIDLWWSPNLERFPK